MNKAIVKTETGLVINVVVLDPDEDDSFDHWPCPDGCEIMDPLGIAGPGDTWDGTTFIRPEPPGPLRLDVLLSDGDLATDKTELLELLRAKLALSENLTWQEINKLLALQQS